MDRTTTVLYCNCSNAAFLPADRRRMIRAGLDPVASQVTTVADLCRLAATRDQRLSEFPHAEDLKIIACYPRAIRAMFEWAGIPLAEERTTFLNMRTQSTEEILDNLGIALPPANAAPIPVPEEATDAWRPWFPVIDRQRCTDCGHCLNFCLFGVYERDWEERVTVAHPAKCKNNCPACARMCPQVAIMFPKIEERSPISGDPQGPAAAKGKVQLTQDELFGGDLAAKLARRSKQRALLKQQAGPESRK